MPSRQVSLFVLWRGIAKKRGLVRHASYAGKPKYWFYEAKVCKLTVEEVRAFSGKASDECVHCWRGRLVLLMMCSEVMPKSSLKLR